MREHPQIAIDGPAGVGKSTIGERVARHLGCLYVDSGAFYRALTVLAVNEQIDPDDEERLTALAESSNIRIVTPTVSDGRQYTVLAGNTDITPALRTPEVETNVSRVSRHPSVRDALRVLQQAMADDQTVVMVGRDIGTVVLPDADLKIWLTPSLEQRAQRRHGDLVASMGEQAPTLDFETLYSRLKQYIPYTPIHNVAGTPAMSVPLGMSNDGLPIGSQFAAAKGREDLLYALAYELEAAQAWTRRTPKVWVG